MAKDAFIMRMTSQRLAILEELRKVRIHPTAEELHCIIKRRLPTISLATVYRNLEELSQRGAIVKLACGGEQRRFDGFPDEHYHARCLRCGKVEDLPLKPLEAIRSAGKRIKGFSVTGHSLEYVGTCVDCHKRLGAVPK